MNKQTNAYDRTLAAWAKEWCEEHLTTEEREMIRAARYDLYNGPIGDGAIGDPCEAGEFPNYPGFTTACSMIAAVLRRDMPRELYVDTDCEMWSESEPEPYPCEECEGSGECSQCPESPAHCHDCETCDGTGKVEPYTESTYHVDTGELRRAIVGRELAEYVR